MTLIPDPSNKYNKDCKVNKMEVGSPLKGTLPTMRPQLSKKDIQQLKEKLQVQDTRFFIVPTTKLVEMIAKGEPKFLMQLPDQFKTAFLQGGGVVVESSMIIEWLEGNLDFRNAFVFDFSDVRVDGESFFIKGGSK